MTRELQQVDDDFSPPFPKLREPARSRQSDRGEECEKPRRGRRNVPRPDYAEMVANKDPWIIEAEAEVCQISDPVATMLIGLSESSDDRWCNSTHRC